MSEADDVLRGGGTDDLEIRKQQTEQINCCEEFEGGDMKHPFRPPQLYYGD